MDVKELEELYGCVNLLQVYENIEFKFDMPKVCRLQDRENLEAHYEEFLNYQTFNS